MGATTIACSSYWEWWYNFNNLNIYYVCDGKAGNVRLTTKAIIKEYYSCKIKSKSGAVNTHTLIPPNTYCNAWFSSSYTQVKSFGFELNTYYNDSSQYYPVCCIASSSNVCPTPAPTPTFAPTRTYAPTPFRTPQRTPRMTPFPSATFAPTPKPTPRRTPVMTPQQTPEKTYKQKSKYRIPIEISIILFE